VESGEGIESLAPSSKTLPTSHLDKWNPVKELKELVDGVLGIIET